MKIFANVPSPPCGMVTQLTTAGGWRLAALFGFKPTGWDGDNATLPIGHSEPSCPKPTAWDGDPLPGTPNTRVIIEF